MEPVIGLEIHAQLLTASKIFCGCCTAFGAAPNTHLCPVCLGLPGALPVLNRAAVDCAVPRGARARCTVHETSIFARKNYFYPDLPKGYQISQYEQPLATGGVVRASSDHWAPEYDIRITRVHMEEDAGKLLHEGFADSAARSYVDLNRAGTPLIEIVTEPDLRTAADAAAFFAYLRELLVALGVNDGNMEEGSLRCDANVSVRTDGSSPLGTKAEIKNLNSFRFLEEALEHEIARQIDVARSRRTGRAGDAALGQRRRSAPSRCAARKRRTTTGIFPSRTCRRSSLEPARIAACAATMPELPAGCAAPADVGATAARTADACR